MRTVYVTGVAGLLGSNVAKLLLSKGYTVRGCDDLSVGQAESVPDGVAFRKVSCQHITDMEFLLVDAVVHCAAIARSVWPDEDDLWESNVHATMRVMQVAKKNEVSDIVHASSSVVPYPQTSVYAKTKAVAEQIALGFGATCLRFGNIYGPGQNEAGAEPNLIAQMRRSVRDDGCVRVDGDGSQTRDFVHVDDAAAAVHAALSRSARTWLDICSGSQTSIHHIAERFGCPIEYAESRGDPPAIVQDPEPAKWVLGWEPKISLEEGLAQVIP